MNANFTLKHESKCLLNKKYIQSFHGEKRDTKLNTPFILQIYSCLTPSAEYSGRPSCIDSELSHALASCWGWPGGRSPVEDLRARQQEAAHSCPPPGWGPWWGYSTLTCSFLVASVTVTSPQSFLLQYDKGPTLLIPAKSLEFSYFIYMSISTTFVSSYPIKWRHVFPSGKLAEHSPLPEVITENLLESPNRKPQKHRSTLKSAEPRALRWEKLTPRNGNSPNLINRCNINRYSILIVLFPVNMNKILYIHICIYIFKQKPCNIPQNKNL